MEVVDARTYLTKPEYGELRGVKVFNLCRSYRYQTLGYYVTLLATARGHKPLPNIMSLQDLKSQTVVRFVSDDLDELIQKQPGADRVGKVHAQHLLRPQPGPSLRSAEPAPVQPVPGAAAAGPVRQQRQVATAHDRPDAGR